MDFSKSGSCAIQGSDASSEAVSKFISKNKEGIEEIYVGLDSHHRMHISHAVFWTNTFNESPPVYTELSADQILGMRIYLLNYCCFYTLFFYVLSLASLPYS